MADSIFSKIIRGEIPSYKVYENEYVYAFLDINPIKPGHTLVVPKTEVDHLWDLEAEHYRELMLAAKKIAHHMRGLLPQPRIGLVVEGFAVPHAHLHLIPVDEGFETTLSKPKTDENSEEDLKKMAEKLYFED